MGLLRKGKKKESEGSEIASDRIERDFEVIEGYTPEWADQFPDFPYTLSNLTVYRKSVKDGKADDRYVIKEEDRHLVAEAIKVINTQLAASYDIAKLPLVTQEEPGFEPDSANPFWGNYCFLHATPFTKKGNLDKIPFVLEMNTRTDQKSMTSKVGFLPDGQIAAIESIFHDEMIDEYYTIHSRLRAGTLTIDHISASLSEETPTEPMEMLYSIWR